MASKKSIIDEAYPGDIVGLHDTGNFKIGDTLTEGEKLHFKGIPSFSPELFKYIENADPMKSKQLAKGIDQLMDEGVAQLFTNQFNNRKIIGTVGALQFEVYRVPFVARVQRRPVAGKISIFTRLAGSRPRPEGTGRFPSSQGTVHGQGQMGVVTFSSPNRSTCCKWRK